MSIVIDFLARLCYPAFDMKNILLNNPRDCYLILTDRCNMRCRHCYGKYGINSPQKELDGDQWISVINELVKNDIFFVNISGGEPTLHPDFCRILNEINKNNLLYLLTTNGLFSKKILSEIKKSRETCLGIKISLDGIDAESFSFLRRDINGRENPDFFKIINDNIMELIKENIPVTIATCLHPKNIHIMEQMKQFIIRLKPANWFISTISLSGSAKDNDIYVSESILPKDFWLKLKEECREAGISVSFVDMPSLIKSKNNRSIYFNCPAARTFCEIYSDGTVSPCPLCRVHIPEEDLPRENIKNKTLHQIWNGKSFATFRSLQHKGCDGCKMIKKCDRCVPQSYQWFNDAKMPPPYCVLEAESLGLKNSEQMLSRLESIKEKFKRDDYGR